MVFQFLTLPSSISAFERDYLRRMNRIALWFFVAHLPALAVIAGVNRTGAWSALALGGAVLTGPLAASFLVDSPRAQSVVHGITAMFMGGLLVHFGQGPMQIEMHFYFFALIAMCAVFANPMVIVSATATVALHHLLVWLVLPRSVFNYDASVWVVAVHAAFVVLDAIAACFIARSFFDNVIGLERIVQARTAALDAKNGEMRLLLDHLHEGILTIDQAGNIVGERSAALAQWFEISAHQSWVDVLTPIDPSFAARTQLAFSEVVEAVMPLELTLDQMPHELTCGATHLLVAYRPIGDAQPPSQFLVIVTDVTAEVSRQRAEQASRESMALFQRFFADRSGFEAFFAEGHRLIESLSTGAISDGATIRRHIHTLKGNAALFGVDSLAAQCHALEDAIAETSRLPTATEYAPLLERWSRLEADRQQLFGKRPRTIELEESAYRALVTAVEQGESPARLLRRLTECDREPTAVRLSAFAEQGRRIAQRLEKEIVISVEDHGVRLDAQRWAPFWAGYVHAVRNAIDHGVEAPEIRRAQGKPQQGTLALRTFADESSLVFEIADDGRGIDWSAIAERAQRAGLPSRTAEDLQRALFAEGISTASEVTDLSGRGVGMSVLRESARELDGDISVVSSTSGTTLRIRFPLAAAEATSLAA